MTDEIEWVWKEAAVSFGCLKTKTSIKIDGVPAGILREDSQNTVLQRYP
jgi:hypothetical protein